MSSKIVEIIREYVLQTLAQQGSIPYRITQTQFRAATDSVIQCLESASRNRDASPRVIQREATLLALQTIPRAIADVSVQLDNGPSPPPTGSADTQPDEDETPIDDLVQRELARRQEQDAAMGVIQPASTSSYSLPTSSDIPPPQPHPTTQPDTQQASQPDIQPANTPPKLVKHVSSLSLASDQPHSHPSSKPDIQPANKSHTTPTHTIAIPHNPEETSPIRIRYTPSQTQRTTQIDRVIMPLWVRGDDIPFIVCSVMGTDVFLFPSLTDPRILIPRPHQLPPNPTTEEMVFTFRTPDGELIDTNGERTGMINIQNKETTPGVLVNTRIRNTLSGVRIKFKDDAEYRERVYPYTDAGFIHVPLPDNEAPIESALGNLRSPWAISIFIT